MTASTADPDLVRRLAVEGALLAGPRPPATAEGVMAVANRLGGLQLDPTRTIERTEQLVVWSRLGNYDRALLDQLLRERRLFEHAAFFRPIDRLAEFRAQQKAFREATTSTGGSAGRWIEANARFHRSILDQLRANGPLPSRALDTSALAVHWKSSGWTNNRDITRMLEFMDYRGEVAISGRDGAERLWDLPERFLPPTEELSYVDFLRRRSLLLVRRMGVATMMEVRARTGELPDIDRPFLLKLLNELAEEGRLVAVDDKNWRHADADLDVKPALTTFLSPFEPLITDREKTERIWGFRYKLEMYVPKTERQFGHYTLPVLHGDRLVGRLDGAMDRKAHVLRVNGLHWESEPKAKERATVDAAIGDLAAWLGAESISRD
jgi:uncharacterized protein YcaQ